MEEKTTMNSEAQHCAFCGSVIEGDNFGIVDGEIMCPDRIPHVPWYAETEYTSGYITARKSNL